jgi:hypothetical protein
MRVRNEKEIVAENKDKDREREREREEKRV